ncbi:MULTISPECIES: TetR/AcrR family transcriptional regulator [unclassified Gordonia (in: high G+C Gram-positive bacteria)]|uniref:TetR/AcrR family transcriptional regulator n=1 Tax=unclassified Gordonia (in: high G+C Gram-positive bacteria) TaxID=2657482 RepID=UPI001FFED601|nr:MULTISPECIES: TetR/AcrR family transcriptional regulator [unclassified Gordonia (in: high G+C Gram-positive bacteria)]UQE75351.1 TetR/AcrR family transcriptional regulator [Gordonia sp. PP30]
MPPAKLTIEQIVDAAIDIADRDGLDAVSMRRIADRLGVGAMSLYRHVADKDALLSAMSAEVGRRFPYPVGEPGPWTWRERVAIAVDVDWRLYQRHPWVLLTYAVPRYGLTPDCLAGLEWLAEGFAELGVDDATAVEMALTLWNHVDGAALISVSDQLLRSPAPAEGSGGLAEVLSASPTDARLAGLPLLSRVAGGEAVSRLVDQRAVLDAGVARLCDGFAAAAPDPR